MKTWRIPLDASRQVVPRGQVYVVKERCKGCEFCVHYCPCDVLAMSDEFNAKGYHPAYVRTPENCLDCGLCEMICPEFAIFSVNEHGAIATTDRPKEIAK
jgi:2-oxoglutarate ferredoxin oxidoreductase subunit delta